MVSPPCYPSFYPTSRGNSAEQSWRNTQQRSVHILVSTSRSWREMRVSEWILTFQERSHSVLWKTRSPGTYLWYEFSSSFRPRSWRFRSSPDRFHFFRVFPALLPSMLMAREYRVSKLFPQHFSEFKHELPMIIVTYSSAQRSSLFARQMLGFGSLRARGKLDCNHARDWSPPWHCRLFRPLRPLPKGWRQYLKNRMAVSVPNFTVKVLMLVEERSI